LHARHITIASTHNFYFSLNIFDYLLLVTLYYFPEKLTTTSPTSSPTLTEEPTGDRRARDLSQEEVDSEKVERELQRIEEDDDLDTGVIVQKIFFTCNQRLPLSPKAI
jgi:nitric oxide reductase activation protein